jgi:filamentous hemagglutinin
MSSKAGTPVFVYNPDTGELVLNHVGKTDLKPTVLATDSNVIQMGNSNNAAIWTNTKKKTNIENAYGHWEKHKSEFPEYQNSLEYVKATKEFLNNPPKNSMIKVRPNGDVVIYDPQSGIMGIKNSDGTPKTMYRPDPNKHPYSNNIDYFNAQ